MINYLKETIKQLKEEYTTNPDKLLMQLILNLGLFLLYITIFNRPVYPTIIFWLIGFCIGQLIVPWFEKRFIE